MHIYLLFMENVAKKETAKLIVLAGMWKRAFAFLFDMATSAALACLIYFCCIFPFVSDAEAQRENQIALNARRIESGLYLDFDGVAVNPLSYASIRSVEDCYSAEVVFGEEKQEFSLLNTLYEYWTLTCEGFGNVPVKHEDFAQGVLDAAYGTGAIKGIEITADGQVKAVYDEKDELNAYSEIYGAYDIALSSLYNDEKIKAIDDAMSEDARNALLWALPAIVGSLAVFYLLVPLCYSDGQTFGKKIFKMVVLTKLGYYYSRPKRVGRYFAFLFELALCFLSFGALLLVTYTMAMFTKKHRCIHDYLSGSVVAKEEDSLWFADPQEEEEYNERQDRKGVNA